MATKIPVAQKRLFANVFVCRDCSHRIRSDSNRIISKKVRCRICGSRIFRPVRKK
jgi:DNA-directed RNA polymerase subunit RPC12/RpoP